MAIFTIDHMKIDSDLYNFPVGIILGPDFLIGLGSEDSQYLHAEVNEDQCYIEIENWLPQLNMGAIWVKVPILSSSSDTAINVYIGESPNDDHLIVPLVWESNHAGVWDMCMPPVSAPFIFESTMNGNNATPGGSMTDDDMVPGDFGLALDFDGTDDRLTVPASASLNDLQQKTIEIFFNADSWGGNNCGRLVKKGGPEDDSGWQVYISQATGTIEFTQAFNGNATIAKWRAETNAVSLSTPIYVVITYDRTSTANDPTIEINGVAQTVTEIVAPVGSADSDAAQDLWIAAREATSGGADCAFDGRIDVVRVSNVIRSGAWRKAAFHCLAGTIFKIAGKTTVSGGVTLGLSAAAGATNLSNQGGSAGLGLSARAGATFGNHFKAAAILGLSATAGRNIEISRGGQAGLGLSAVAGRNIERTKSCQAGLGFSATAGAFNFTRWMAANAHRAIYSYFARITGDGDGLDDFEFVGLKSFQFRRRSGEPSYLAIVIVFSNEAQNAITARKHGQIIVDMVATVGESQSLREELTRADFDSVRSDKGPSSKSLTLTGYKTQTFGANRIALQDVMTETTLDDGRLQYRCARPDFYLRPGDTAIHGPDEIVVGSITCIVSPVSQSMYVQEAAV